MIEGQGRGDVGTRGLSENEIFTEILHVGNVLDKVGVKIRCHVYHSKLLKTLRKFHITHLNSKLFLVFGGSFPHVFEPSKFARKVRIHFAGDRRQPWG